MQQCELISNHLKIVVHQLHIDVEEEAAIKTIGRVRSGDSETLEIYGTFQLAHGAIVRSMLLWNGDEILKAKLKERAKADSAYEEVVDRNEVRYIPRDPAVIEYQGSNTYGIKIYPVAINKSRRIRILYSIPLQAFSGGTRFIIRPAFAYSVRYNCPDKIPVKIVKGENFTDSCTFQYEYIKKKVNFGSTYHIPVRYLGSSYTKINPLYLYLRNPSLSRAYSCVSDDYGEQAYYTVIVSRIPDTLQDFLFEKELWGISFEARLDFDDEKHIIDILFHWDREKNGYFSVYAKSKKKWDGKIHWTLFDKEGYAATVYTQKIPLKTDEWIAEELPLVWAAHYTIIDNKGNLGALFGFVDSEMSLLALESDVLDPEAAGKYENEGVPLLSDDEIVIDADNLPELPEEYLKFERVKTIPAMPDKTVSSLGIEILHNTHMLLTLPGINDKLVRIEFFDLSGRLLCRLDALRVVNEKIRLLLPAGLKGTVIVNVTAAGTTVLQQRITLK
jgi:hypothetical protein